MLHFKKNCRKNQYRIPRTTVLNIRGSCGVNYYLFTSKLFIYFFTLLVAECILVECNVFRLNVMHSGKRGEFENSSQVTYFSLIPDYVAARSLSSLGGNNFRL